MGKEWNEQNVLAIASFFFLQMFPEEQAPVDPIPQLRVYGTVVRIVGHINGNFSVA